MSTRLAKGNDAVVIGALYAGCDCYFGYPITPASEIAQGASLYFPRLGREFLQAESETAAINMVYGAAGAGHRSMTASSGPGVSLMVEGISYSAGAELPCVIVDIMRAGPGLGNIGPEQGDYNQVVKGGGHGNYKNIVLAPASVQEMCDFTMEAFELADKYRTPVFVLADGVLGQMIEPLRFPENPVTPSSDESWAVTGKAKTRGNVITSIFLDFDELEAFNDKLQEKYARIEAAEARAESYLTDDADLVFVAYGISSRIARTAADICRQQGLRVGLVRPQTLFPFPKQTFQDLVAERKPSFLAVEMSNGQMADDVRLAIGGKCPVDLISRLGGNLMTVEQVVEKASQILA